MRFLPIVVVAGFVPLVLAAWANRRTSLGHALIWASLAWASWALAFFVEPEADRELSPCRYVALAMTACAGIAVLGARRPYVAAWNFVVLGLLAITLLPLGESLILRTRSTDGLRAVFLALAIGAVTLNYLPTRMWPAALVLMLACEAEIVAPYVALCRESYFWIAKDCALAGVPWLAWLAWRTRGATRNEVDQIWLDFRDRWGFVWGQRMREQFNTAAENAALPIRLGWRGISPVDAEDPEKYLQTLNSVLQRFLEPVGERN